MNKIEKLRGSGCAVTFGLDIFGDRWSLLIIRDMMLYGKQTYGEFLAGDEAIATNILADRLKQLESVGIIQKQRDMKNRRRFLYQLTEKGRDLAPVLIEIIRWSGRHDQRPFARKTVYNDIQQDPKRFEDRLRST